MVVADTGRVVSEFGEDLEEHNWLEVLVALPSTLVGMRISSEIAGFIANTIFGDGTTSSPVLKLAGINGILFLVSVLMVSLAAGRTEGVLGAAAGGAAVGSVVLLLLAIFTLLLVLTGAIDAPEQNGGDSTMSGPVVDTASREILGVARPKGTIKDAVSGATSSGHGASQRVPPAPDASGDAGRTPGRPTEPPAEWL